MSLKKILLLVMILFFVCACSKTRSLSPDTSPLAVVGAKHFGPQQEFFIFPVPSLGFEEDKVFISRSKTYGASSIAKRLGNLISGGEVAEVRIVVGGPSSIKSKQVVLDALALNKDRVLGGLVLVFVGEADDARQIQPLAKKHLATLFFSGKASM